MRRQSDRSDASIVRGMHASVPPLLLPAYQLIILRTLISGMMYTVWTTDAFTRETDGLHTHSPPDTKAVASERYSERVQPLSQRNVGVEPASRVNRRIEAKQAMHVCSYLATKQ